MQLQNIRVDTVHGTQAGHHADVLQTWAGPRQLRIDGLSGSTGYQGMMLNPNDSSFGGGVRTGRTRTGQPAAALSWRPPKLTAPLTVQVSSSRPSLVLDDDKDYVVKLPATPVTTKGGVTIRGGRNVVLIGGEIRAPSARQHPQATTDAG